MSRPSIIHETVVFKSDNGEERLTISEALVRYLELGVYIETACGALGISPATYYKWVARGAKHAPEEGVERESIPPEEVVYVEFVEAVTRARERGIAWHEVNLRRGAEKDPRISLEYLARRRREVYARELKIEHGGTVTHEIDQAVNEEIEHAHAEIERLTERLADVADSGEAQAPGPPASESVAPAS